MSEFVIFIGMPSVYQKFGKRLIDLLASLLGLLLLSPILLVIAVLIKFDSHGPVIFKQKRAGKGGQPFTFYKFRTMVVDAEQLKAKYSTLNQADGPVFKIRNDPRYTQIGKFLSHTGLDELPQLLNILKGEMSLVGPRPLPVEEEDKIAARYQIVRRSVKPGLVSSWILKGAHHLSFNRWMDLDLEDVKKRSLLYDSIILLQTISLVVILSKDELFNKRLPVPAGQLKNTKQIS